MAATVRKVDLRNVKEGGNFRPTRKPEGDYVSKIIKVDDHIKEGKTPGWVFTVKIKGDERSAYPIYASPDEKQVWKLAKLFTACGVKLPKSIVKLDPNKLVGKMVGVYLEDDEYEGKLKSSIGDFMLASEVVPPEDQDDQDGDELEPDDEIDTGDEDDEDDDEEVIPEPVKRKAKKAPEPEPEDDDDEDEDDEEEPPPPPVKKRKKKTTPPPPPVEEDDDDEDDDEDEPEPTPPPKKRVKKKAKPAPVADDEDDDLDLDEL